MDMFLKIGKLVQKLQDEHRTISDNVKLIQIYLKDHGVGYTVKKIWKKLLVWKIWKKW